MLFSLRRCLTSTVLCYSKSSSIPRPNVHEARLRPNDDMALSLTARYDGHYGPIVPHSIVDVSQVHCENKLGRPNDSTTVLYWLPCAACIMTIVRIIVPWIRPVALYSNTGTVVSVKIKWCVDVCDVQQQLAAPPMHGNARDHVMVSMLSLLLLSKR